MPGAYGAFMFPDLPYAAVGAGLRTSLGTLVPPGSRIQYVRSTGIADGDGPELSGRIHATLNSAAGECRSGRGDTIRFLPGHVESLATADAVSNLVAGTTIVGDPMFPPTLTWTAAAASFLVDQADVTLANLILNMDPGAGVVNVAAPLTISGPRCKVINCQMRMGTDANSLVTIGITTTATAKDLVIAGNEIYGATAAECTTMIQLVGADRLKFVANSIVGATSAVGVGPIRFLTTASTFIKMFDNSVRNNKALSTAAITGMAGISGEVDNLHMTVLSDNAAALVLNTGAFATVGSLSFGDNVYVTNLIGERAAKVTPVST